MLVENCVQSSFSMDYILSFIVNYINSESARMLFCEMRVRIKLILIFCEHRHTPQMINLARDSIYAWRDIYTVSQ